MMWLAGLKWLEPYQRQAMELMLWERHNGRPIVLFSRPAPWNPDPYPWWTHEMDGRPRVGHTFVGLDQGRLEGDRTSLSLHRTLYEQQPARLHRPGVTGTRPDFIIIDDPVDD